MSNPLIEKFYELHPEKKEKPKVIKTDKFEGEVTVSQVENAFKKWTSSTSIKGNQIGYTCIDEITKPPSLKTYDPDSVNVSFQQIAEKIKNGKAKVSSVSINADAVGGFNTGLRTYTFEVMDWDI